jgi:hypothetical protein
MRFVLILGAQPHLYDIAGAAFSGATIRDKRTSTAPSGGVSQRKRNVANLALHFVGLSSESE